MAPSDGGLRRTAEPPNAMLLAFASLSWTVIVTLLAPSATMLPADDVIVDCDGVITCPTVMLIVFAIELAPDRASIVAVPFATAVTNPLKVPIVTKALPAVTDHRTSASDAASGTPLVFSTVALSVVVAPNAVSVVVGAVIETLFAALVTVTTSSS